MIFKFLQGTDLAHENEHAMQIAAELAQQANLVAGK